MFLFFLPIIIIVSAQVIYDVSAKAINEDLNAYAGTTIIYSILAVVYSLIYLIFTPDPSISAEWSQINWAVLTYAIGSIGLESGYIFLYRAGWNISLGGMVCNILLAMCMLAVGFMIYHERVSLIQCVGIAFCIAGLLVVFKAGGSQKKVENDTNTPQKLD